MSGNNSPWGSGGGSNGGGKNPWGSSGGGNRGGRGGGSGGGNKPPAPDLDNVIKGFQNRIWRQGRRRKRRRLKSVTLWAFWHVLPIGSYRIVDVEYFHSKRARKICYFAVWQIFADCRIWFAL